MAHNGFKETPDSTDLVRIRERDGEYRQTTLGAIAALGGGGGGGGTVATGVMVFRSPNVFAGEPGVPTWQTTDHNETDLPGFDSFLVFFGSESVPSGESSPDAKACPWAEITTSGEAFITASSDWAVNSWWGDFAGDPGWDFAFTLTPGIYVADFRASLYRAGSGAEFIWTGEQLHTGGWYFDAYADNEGAGDYAFDLNPSYAMNFSESFDDAHKYDSRTTLALPDTHAEWFIDGAWLFNGRFPAVRSQPFGLAATLTITRYELAEA